MASEMRSDSWLRPRFETTLAIMTIAFAAGSILILPETHWEMDEILFHLGIEEFDPRHHHPHPPGYPLLIGLGKILNLLIGDPFTSLVTLSFLSVVIGFAALAVALRNATGSEATALTGTTLFHLSPAMLVHGTTPMSDPPALMFLSLAFWAISDLKELGTRRLALFGLFAAASIGCRPQYAVPILPVFLIVVFFTRGIGRRAAALGTFTAVCLAWIIPLITAVGGPTSFIEWQTAQAVWVAEVDAGVARHSLSALEVVKRFAAHPWGPKQMSLPILLLAAIGLARAMKLRLILLLPVFVVGLVHFVFTAVTCDPADGVRYMLPSQIATATFAAVGLTWIVGRAPRAPVLQGGIVTLLVTAFWVYAWPVVSVRSSSPSPPVAAIESARNLSTGALVLYDDSMTPHATALLPPTRFQRFEEGSSIAFDDPSLEVLLLGEGQAVAPDAMTFVWPDSDAYGKLTRNHYRVVTLDPLRPEERFLPIDGVGPWQSADGKLRWRWLMEDARIEIPPCCGPLDLVLSLPEQAPYERVGLTLEVDGRRVGRISLDRNAIKRARVDLPDEAGTIHIVSDRGFIPANARPSSDPRKLSVQLLDLRRAAHH